MIEECWPQTEVYLCEWHLRHALERLLEKIGGQTAERLLPRTEAAFAGARFWEVFAVEARELGDLRVDAWLDRWSVIIASQLGRRGRPTNDRPLSTGGLEELIKPIQESLHRRRYGIKNRDRLNRLLLLFQLEVNCHADERGFAKSIRGWLEANGGRPSIPRRAIADPAARPSLRDPGARLAPARTRRRTRTSDQVPQLSWDDL